MSWRLITIMSLLLLSACSRDHAPADNLAPAGAAPASHATSTEMSARLDANGSLSISARTDGSASALAEIDAPAGLADGSISTFSDQDILGLAHARQGRLEICIASTAGSLPHELELSAQSGDNDSQRERAASIAVADNRITDLLILRTTDQNYRLTWTATNVGDYDHNGEVNVADLIPLASSLGESAPAGHPWTSHDPQYYTDGDGNNELNIADITPIARNLGNNIRLFDIYADGELLQQVMFNDSLFTQGSGLPPRYNVLVPTESVSSESGLSLVPISIDGNQLAPPSTTFETAELSVLTDYGDLELLDLCAEVPEPGAEHGTDSCLSILRIIDPIDDIGSWEPPSGYIPELGMTLFNNLKRNKLCYVEASFLPRLDPADGSLNVSTGPDSPGIRKLSYPIYLPDDGNRYEMHISLTEVAYPGDGVYLDVFADSSIPGRISALPIRLHPALDRVARDLDGDGDYEDESWLRDSDHNSLSDSLEEKLRTDDKYYISEDVQLVGTVQDILPDKGQLILASATEYGDESSEIEHDLVTIHYTELTEFEQVNPLNQSLDPQKIRSAEISPGLQLAARCTVQRLTQFGEAINYWAERVTQNEPFGDLNTIYVTPALTERRPGQTVNVTVFANHTEAAFNSLELMTLHVLGGAEVVPGSINPGIQGGADDYPDGIWQLLGPPPLELDAAIYPMGFFAGKYFQNFDVSISSTSSLNLSQATGALFNFDLRIYEPAVVLAGYRYKDPVAIYSDAQGNPHDWISQHDDDSLFVNLRAAPPTLSLLDPAISGNGTYFDPYVIAQEIPYRVMVSDELDGDVTSDPNCWYVASPEQACELDYFNPVIQVPAGFSGSFTVHALYPGNLQIPAQFNRRVYFRTE